MPGGKKPGPSIKNPATYEALKKKGLSKESAASISNWAVGQGYKKGVHHKSHDEDDDYDAVDGWLRRGGNAMRDREFSASRREELAKSGKAMCLAGETRVVTLDGDLPISSLVGQYVELLTRDE